MTNILKKSLLILVLLSGSFLQASVGNCQPGQSSVLQIINGVEIRICYPATANVGDTITIQVLMANVEAATAHPNAYEFLPNFNVGGAYQGAFSLNSLTQAGTPVADTLNSTDTSHGVNGTGVFGYQTTALPAGTGGATATATLTVLAPGVYTYTPVAFDTGLGSGVSFAQITITVPCTTTGGTASNATSVTACSHGTVTGNLNSLVTGPGPFTFTTTGAVDGNVSVNASGIYTFTSNVSGPATGSFNYQGSNPSGCMTNTGTITVPIAQSPVAGNDVLYTTSFGTPVTVTPNFTGGTAPFTFTTTILGNATTSYNSGTNQVTINQTSPGASLVQYTITDANGCVIDRPANIYVYSCVLASDTQVVAALVDNCIYSLCAPTTVFLGQQFTLTATISNPNPNTSRNGHDFHDIVPDPTQVAPPCPCDPGLQFIIATTLGAATFTSNTPTGLAEGGMGDLLPTGGTVAAATDLQVFQTIQATAVGLQNYTAFVISNPNVVLPTLFINVISCPTITAGDASFTGCTGSFTGNLTPLVTGGSGPYTFVQNGTASCPDVTLNPTSGVFTFVAIPTGTTGPCSFQYSVTDSNGCTSGLGTVTVVGNQGATANDLSFTLCEASTITGASLSATGGIPPYTFAIVTNGTLGTATITDPTNGIFDYIPNNDFTFGNDSFTYTVTDSTGCVSVEATVSITIFEKPQTAGILLTGCVNASISGNLNSFITSGSGPFTFFPTGVSTGVGGTAFIGATGPFTFTPTPNFSGIANFNFGVTDVNSCTGVGLVNINFTAPIAGNTSAQSCVNGSVIVNVPPLVTGGIPPYSFTVTGSIPCGNVTVNENNTFTFTPNTGFSGLCPFTYQVTDSLGCIATGEVDVTVSSPIVSSTSVRDCQNSSVSGNVSSLVTAGFPPYTFGPVTSASGGSATINPSGVFNFTATTGITGQGGFQYLVTDSNACTAVGNVDVIIGIPLALNTGIRDCVNGSVVGDVSPLVIGGFPPYIFSATGTPVGGVVTILPGGFFNFTAASGFRGTGNFAFQANDQNNCIATGNVTVTISSPIASNTAVRDCVNGAVSGNLAPLVTSGFPPYTFSATGSPLGGTVTVNPSGIFTFTGNSGFSGLGDFVYQVTDSNGCLATGLVDVLVSSPIAQNLTTRTICINGSLTGDVSGLVTSGFPPYTFGLNGVPVGGIATVNPSGIFNFTAATGFSGIGSFVYQATDTNNCRGTGLVSIPIASPIVSSTSVSTCNNTLIDSLAPLVTGGAGNFTFTGPIGGISCTGGSVTISPSGIFSFTAPNTGFTGACSFVFEATDSNLCSSTGSVTITPNTAPIANSILLITCFETPLTDTLANSVIGGVPPLTFTQVGTAVGGTVVLLADGTFTFTPAAGFLGTASFQYEVGDSSTPACVSNVATVTINVENCCPVCVTGSFACVMDSLIP